MQRIGYELKSWGVRLAAALLAGAGLASCDEHKEAGTELVFTAHLFRDEVAAPFPSGQFTASGTGADIALEQVAGDPTLYRLTDGTGPHLVRFVPMHKTALGGERRDFILIEETSAYNGETSQFREEFIYRMLITRGGRHRLEGDLAAFLAAGVTVARCPEILTDDKALRAAGAPALPGMGSAQGVKEKPGWLSTQAIDLFVSGFSDKMISLFPGPQFKRNDFPNATAYGAQCRQFAESTFVQRYGTPSALTAPSDLMKTQRPGFEAALNDAVTVSRAIFGQDARLTVQFLRWLSEVSGSEPTGSLAEKLLAYRKSRASGWLKFSPDAEAPPPGSTECGDTVTLPSREGLPAPEARARDIRDLEAALPLASSQCPHIPRLSVFRHGHQEEPIGWLWRERNGWSADWVDEASDQE